MSEKMFTRFSSFIYERVGITLPPAKKVMLEARLHKRLKALSLGTFEAYADFVFSPAGEDSELIHMIDVVTTNKTDFFREPFHFEYLTTTALPDILRRRHAFGSDPLRVWSAGCSSGEEPYTLSMVLADQAEKRRDFKFKILASDISTRILDSARKAVYPGERVEPVPMAFRKKYLLRSRDPGSDLVRICPELRCLVNFHRINFMDHDFGLREKMDIIFCRNVVIYFDKQTQETLMRKFHAQLRQGGYLFIGHSESLTGLDVEFRGVASTVYQKP